MNKQTVEVIMDEFCRVNQIDTIPIAPKVRILIAHSATPFYLFAECLTPSGHDSSPDPVDGFLEHRRTQRKSVSIR